MEGVLYDAIRLLKRAEPEEAYYLIRFESKHLEVTKSLLNILFNICFTKAITLTQRQKAAFRPFDKVVMKLLVGARQQTNRTTDLQGKRRLLLRNVDLVKLIAQACPSPASLREASPPPPPASNDQAALTPGR